MHPSHGILMRAEIQMKSQFVVGGPLPASPARGKDTGAIRGEAQKNRPRRPAETKNHT